MGIGEIKNNPQVYTTQESKEEIKNNPQVYTTQVGREEIKNNPQVYTTQEGILGFHPRDFRLDDGCYPPCWCPNK